MAPPTGHLLLPKIWRAARFAYEKASKAIRTKFPETTQYTAVRYQPAYARINRQPISRVAAIRQARSRHFSTRAAGAFTSAVRNGLGLDGPVRNTSRIVSSISRLSSRAPFASTLRPNLTGGTLGRTAGGYAVGAGRFGGARYYSHGPAAPAQVIQNVSQGVRAFFLSGQKVRFDGIDPHTGEKRYKAVSSLQDQAERKMNAIPRTAPGSFVDFQVSPTITALGAVSGLEKGSAPTLNSEGLMDLLSADFARALKDFAAVMNDLKRLSTLGDLPIKLHDRSTIRVHFPGCDAETVEQLCGEAGVQRGRIVQDEDFDIRTGADLALLFPFAPSVSPSSDTDYYFEKAPKKHSYASDIDWHGMMTPESLEPSSPGLSRDSGNAISFQDSELFGDNPWKSSPRSYSSINISELGDNPFFPEVSSAGQPETASAYDGSDGIYNFLAECDRAQR
ncbi:uncharacterized protein N7529_007818 [Penicillium soppii]|uniref:uncharacterized protein n=1 Tax=Penicillium soppii TaxID=69789 RepID=UPI00254693AD|nr:uncharacterized protein N7529_007818 [Penicillium soppii]KAJ5860508.1 hypothetical protein N7529_007818 [Penicillium soppii]